MMTRKELAKTWLKIANELRKQSKQPGIQRIRMEKLGAKAEAMEHCAKALLRQVAQ